MTPIARKALMLRPTTKPTPRAYSKIEAANNNGEDADEKVCKDSDITTKLW